MTAQTSGAQVSGAQAALLPDGRRLHLHHGPIDLVIDIEGTDRATAYDRAITRFASLLADLVTELPRLRQPLDAQGFCDPVARRMAQAVTPFSGFVTPMAAVAGAVADEVLQALIADSSPTKAYVNNGGDIALHLAPGQSFGAAGPSGDIRIDAAQPVRGLATSGWRGRSQSLGIADAVTVLARTAAEADVAATLIANAVDLPGHAAITRQPACDLNPDSDLGTRPVTTSVDPLTESEITQALARGAATAQAFLDRGLIHEAALTLQTRHHVVSRKEPAHAQLSTA